MKLITNAKPLPPPSFEDDDGLLVFSQLAESVALVTASKVGTKPKKKAVTKRQRKSVDQRCRKRFSFWLDMDKVGQVDLWEWFTELKLRREFAPVIRIAVSLYRELVNGRYEMLHQLFPETAPKPMPPMPSPEIEKLKNKIDNLQDQVDLLKSILIKQSGPGAVDMGVKMASIGQGIHKVAPAVDDDDDTPLVIRKDETAGARSAENFIRSAFALNGMVYEGSANQ